MTTAYANDIVILTQVLVADDGTIQTANLFGLDLVLQDSGAVTRTLLTDGLGSVRAAMVGESVETVTTYNPYRVFTILLSEYPLSGGHPCL